MRRVRVSEPYGPLVVSGTGRKAPRRGRGATTLWSVDGVRRYTRDGARCASRAARRLSRRMITL